MNHLPLTFPVEVKSGEGVQAPWTVRAGEFEAACAVPAEFGGGGGAFSPEDFFALALANCFVGTFKVYAQMSRLKFSDLQVTAHLSVDRDEAGQTVMKSCDLSVKITGAERPDRLETLANKVMRSGFILNSVKTQMTQHLEFIPGA